ncbi:MAG: hypothetical protein LBG24_01150 [Treponema sp.]|nr:hypothetical protein [Treponema sp.]
MRGIAGDGGVIEEIRLGTIPEHDLALSRDMLVTRAMLTPGDSVINDRGFVSREVMNTVNVKREVDTYSPVKKNRAAYEEAVRLARKTA